MNIVIYGEETLLMEQKLNALKKQYNISDENMNCSTYWMNESSMNEVIEDAMTPPFLSDYKMVIMKNPYFLTTVKQKEVSDNDINMFNEYTSHDNPTTIFVIYNDQSFDERKKVVKELRKNAQFLEIGKIDFHRLFKTTREAIISRGCKIDDDALNLFLNRTGDNLLEISLEVEKLCLYASHITVDHIDKLVSKKVEENVFELTNAVLHKDMGKAVSIYKDLMVNNQEPIALIALIANSLRNIYQVKTLEYKGYTDKEMVSILKLNPRSIYPIRMNAKEFEIHEIKEKINELADLDRKIKTGLIDKNKGLELFLIHL